MLDLSNLNHQQLLLKAGVPQSKIDIMYEKQKRGEKLSNWIKINIEGKETIVKMPESSEEIEKREKLHREKLNKVRYRQKKWLENKGFKKIIEHYNELAQKRGFVDYRDYQNYLARRKGFKNTMEYKNARYHGFTCSFDYYIYLEEQEKLKNENFKARQNIISSIDDETKGYLAGFFDAEGCILLDNERFRLHVSISQSYYPVLDKISRILITTALSSTNESYKNGIHRKKSWSLQLISDNAIPLLECILPHSIDKRKQIEIALKYQKEIKINHSKGHRISIEEREQRKKVYCELQRLKDYNGDLIPYMTEGVLLRYLVGFFDGEGCIEITKNKRHYNSTVYALSVNINNSNFNILKMFQNKFGGDINIHTNREDERTMNNQNYKIVYQWRVVSERALSFIKVIDQYTIVKKEQIKVAIEFKEFQNLRRGLSRKGRNKTAVETQKEEEYYNRLKELKKDTGEHLCTINQCCDLGGNEDDLL